MVMMLKMLRSFFEMVVNLFKKLFARGKKDSAARGGFKFLSLDGPMGFKVFLGLISLTLAGGLVFATLQGGDILRKFQMFLPFEVNVQTTSRDSTISEGKNNIASDMDRVIPALDGPDCERFIKIIKQGGVLNSEDKALFVICQKSMTPEKAALFQQILKGDLSPAVVRNLLEAAEKNPSSIANTVKALENPEIRSKLNDPNIGADVAKSLDVLGALAPEDAAKMLKKINDTPPEYRGATIDAYREVAKIENPEARESLLRTLEAAKNPNEIKDIKNIASAIKSLKPDEQRELAAAFEKSSPEARAELVKTAQIMAALPEDSMARKSLKNLASDIASGKVKPEDAAKMLRDANTVAAATLNTKDPEVKQFLEQELERAAGSQDSVGLSALAGRVTNLVGVSKAISVEPEEAIKLIRNEDSPATADSFALAHQAIKKGFAAEADKLLRGEVAPDELKTKLEAKAKEENRFAAANKPDGTSKDLPQSDVSQETVRQTASDFRRKEIEVMNLEGQLNTLLKAGVPASDPRLAKLFAQLNAARGEKDALRSQFQDLSESLAKRRKDLRDRLSPEFQALGIVVPDHLITTNKEEELESRPRERLSDLREIPEFWGDRRKFGKPGDSQSDPQIERPARRIVKIGAGAAKESNKNGLMGVVAPETNKENYSYTVESSGPGSQVGAATTRQLQISKSLVIPVLMRRIPTEGINNKAQGIRLLAQFLIPVFDRKTGALAISKGAHAICSSGSIDVETGRIQISCSEVETEDLEPVSINLTINAADGTPNLAGVVTTDRGYALAGAWMTAFSQSALQAFASVGVEPYAAKTVKAPSDYLIAGAAGGTQSVMSEIGKAYVDKWLNGPVIWHGYEFMPATAVSAD